MLQHANPSYAHKTQFQHFAPVKLRYWKAQVGRKIELAQVEIQSDDNQSAKQIRAIRTAQFELFRRFSDAIA